MKKIISLLLVLVAVVVMSSCDLFGGNKDNRLEAIIDAENLTYAEIVAKAKEEVGDETIIVYGNSSAFVKACTQFTEETGIKVKVVKEGDADTYNHLSTAFQANQYAADMVLLQDGNMLQAQMLDAGYVQNYVPKDFKSLVAEDDQDPMAAIYLNKVFMYNNTAEVDGARTQGGLTNYITNVWQLAGSVTDPGHIASPSFKTPSTENVNMNFLCMLTSKEWCQKLATAYEAFYGVAYDGTKDEYENIGYKWIAEFLTNSQAHSSDGTACKNAAAAGAGSVVLVNFNKLKDCKESGVGAQDKKNLTAAALEGTVNGFAGFCYKMYALIPTNAKYPYAGCALVNYVISQAGYTAAWGSDVGYYSTNSQIAIASGDMALSAWKNVLVIEDPAYVAKVYEDVTMFVTKYEKA